MTFKQPFCIGKCQVLPHEYSIQIGQEEKQSLQPKLVELLCYLAKQYPRIIPREELIEKVWAGNTYVGEKALTNAIWNLRQNLKGSDGDNEVIETIRKAGYRLLIIPVYENNPDLAPLLQQKTAINTVITSPLKKTKSKLLYLLFTVLIGLFIWQFFNKNEFVQPKITKITKSPGGETFVSPSPNGRFITYKWLTPDGKNNLFLHDRQQPETPAKQLTFDHATQGYSTWSHNGKFLYFSRNNKNQCNIIQLNIKTHQEKVIVSCPINSGYYYLDVSPDDKTLAYHGKESPAKETGIYFISLIDKNAKPRRFSCLKDCDYRERDFAFSPDGDYIAVTRRFSRFNENIFLVNLANKESSQLTFKEQDIVGLAWHPQGKKLVYGAQRADVRSGYILNVKDKTTYNLHLDGFSYPAFARNSGELFYQQRPENYYIARLSLNNTVASSPLPVIQSTYNHLYPHYSSVNNKIIYLSNESGHYELWSADVDGKKREQLTHLQRTIRYPRWSHDGTKVAFLSPLEDQNSDKIFILNTLNNKLSIVNSPYNVHNRPTWSLDDKAILASVTTDEYRDIHLFNINNNSNKRITFDGGRYGIMMSDTEMVYSKNSHGLWKTQLIAEVEKQSFSTTRILKTKMSNSYAWTYHQQGEEQELFFKENLAQFQQITQYNLIDKKHTPIVRVPLLTLSRDFAITTESKNNTLLFTRSRFPQVDIKMLEHPMLAK